MCRTGPAAPIQASRKTFLPSTTRCRGWTPTTTGSSRRMRSRIRRSSTSGALGDYFSSPVAADDKIYTLSEEGRASVIKPGAEWEVLAVNDLADSCKATPAIADSRLYIRTRGALYCFAKRD